MPIIIENLTHTYMPGSVTQFTALYDINLTVEDGEFFGIIGHTGSGKSTLIQQLNGLIQPTSGRVIVDGFDESNLFYTGRTYMDCLEIDSIVIISTEEELKSGEFINVKIIGTDDCDLVGEVV